MASSSPPQMRLQVRIDFITNFVYKIRYMSDNVQREILLSFFKVHILHHAAEEPVYGQSIMQELRRHGYEVSPGTIYPILKRMEARGWLVATDSKRTSNKDRLEYTLTSEGRNILAGLRSKVSELYEEVCLHE